MKSGVRELAGHPLSYRLLDPIRYQLSVWIQGRELRIPDGGLDREAADRLAGQADEPWPASRIRQPSQKLVQG